MLLTDGELEAIRRHSQAEYPAECCGVVLVRRGDASDRTLYRCRNIQDAKHAEDPGRFPSDARRAYYMDPADIQAFTRRDREGYGLHVIYHSHVDVGAYFSQTDRRNALVDGEPAYPEATYIVVGVREGRAEETRAFRWEPASRDFAEVPLTPA